MQKCFACGKDLEPEFAGIETSYQFDNALWMGFHGADGMFVDNIHATMPSNGNDRLLIKRRGLLRREQAVVDPDWEPTFDEDRLLPGQPDYEAVICHECAHKLCETVPWIERLLNAAHSHAHKSKVCDELIAVGHTGWDFGNCHIECMWRHIGNELHRAQRKAERENTT